MNGRAAIAFACAFGAACSLFSACSSYGDSGTTAADAGNVESGGVTANDAGADTTAEAGPAPCPDGGFCDPFEGPTVQGRWDAFIAGAPCTGSLDRSIFAEGSQSLKVSLTSADTDGACSVYVKRGFPRAPKVIRISLRVRVAAQPERGIHILGFDVNTPLRSLFVALRQSGLALAEQEFASANYYVDYPIGGVVPGRFHQIAIEYELATKHVLVSLDDELRLDRTLTRSFDAPSFNISVGAAYVQQGPAIDVWFDDYRFDADY